MCFFRRNMPEKGIEKPKKLCYDTKWKGQMAERVVLPHAEEKNRQSHHGAHHCGARHGGFWAFSQRDAAPAALGTEYHIQELNDNVLTEPGQELTCTITIRCDTVLQSLDSLREEKPLCPARRRDAAGDDGILRRGRHGVQRAAARLHRIGAQLEYSWTPLYDSYYIEGIGHLYEFDAGPESGWMYKVNSSFPNYGCSSYVLTGGEETSGATPAPGSATTSARRLWQMRADAFSKRHPAVNFVFFPAPFSAGMLNQHPAYLLAGGRQRRGLLSSAAWAAGLAVHRGLVLFLVFTAVNPLFNTYGATLLFTYFDRPYTLEALYYGAALAAVFVHMLLWFGCYNAVLTSDKVHEPFRQSDSSALAFCS